MTHRASRITRVLIGGLAASLAAVGGLPAIAHAADKAVSGVSLTWAINKESGNGAYAGGCNFLVAGDVGNALSSHVWTEAEGYYSASSGNVAILKDGADGTAVTPTFATKCQDGTGKAASPAGTNPTNNRVVLSNGTGTVDTTAGTASVSWSGAFTVVFYGGMSYWTATNPTLTVKADGTGTLTATAGGYIASQSDSTVWTKADPTVVTLATLKGVSVTSTGITVTPDYLGVVSSAVTGQVTSGTSAGAFPDSLLTFLNKLGVAAYWYSSGGSADARKVALPLTAAWTLPADPTTPTTPTGNGNVDVTVTVPKAVTPDPGSLTLSVSGAASLGQATASTAGFTASGTLPTVTVTDTRPAGTWSVSGQSSAFTSSAGTIAASALGWAPKSVSGTVQLGATVTSLATSTTLASGAKGEAKVSADLALNAPATTAAGDYTATITLTALG